MEQLIIAGTGVHAAEMSEIACRINREKKTWELLGYITMDTTRVGETYNGYPVLGTVAALRQYPNAHIVPDNEWTHFTEIPPERFISLVDPQSFVSRTARIGRGCVIYPNCYIGLHASLGDFVFCLAGSTINHDTIIENRVIVASGVTLAGSVHVESDCYLGQSCSVRQYIKVGMNSLIGMGSVVVKDVSPDSVMAGNPARKVRARSEI